MRMICPGSENEFTVACAVCESVDVWKGFNQAIQTKANKQFARINLLSFNNFASV